jgi:hypothetical protein
MTQIIKYETIKDFTAANIYFRPLMLGYFPTWEELEAHFMPVYNSLLEDLKTLTHWHLDFESTQPTSLYTVKFLEKFPPQRLTGYYSIQVSPHSSHSNLLHLEFSTEDSPYDSKLVRECTPLLYDISRHQVIACGHPRLFLTTADALQYFSIDPKTWDFSQCKIYHKKDGVLILLYFYEKEWHVASVSSADASEKICQKKLKEIFWETWTDLKYQLPDSDSCYVFEFLHSDTRKIIKYVKNDIVLHGVYQIQNNVICQKDHESVAKFNSWNFVPGWGLQREKPKG